MISLLSRNILVSIILYNLTIEATLQIVDRYKYLYKTEAIPIFETIKVILTMLALFATVTHSLTNDAINDYFLYLAISNTMLLTLQLLIIDRKTLYKRLIKMYGVKRELKSLLTEAIRMKHNLIAGIVNSITKKIIITNIQPGILLSLVVVYKKSPVRVMLPVVSSLCKKMILIHKRKNIKYLVNMQTVILGIEEFLVIMLPAIFIYKADLKYIIPILILVITAVTEKVMRVQLQYYQVFIEESKNTLILAKLMLMDQILGISGSILIKLPQFLVMPTTIIYAIKLYVIKRYTTERLNHERIYEKKFNN